MIYTLRVTRYVFVTAAIIWALNAYGRWLFGHADATTMRYGIFAALSLAGVFACGVMIHWLSRPVIMRTCPHGYVDSDWCPECCR